MNNKPYEQNAPRKPLFASSTTSRLIDISTTIRCLPALAAILSGTAAMAQPAGGLAPTPNVQANTVRIENTANQIQPSGTTILPTDVLPLPTIQNRMTFGENLQLRILQKLPAKFYMSGSVESSFRYETNIFQFPTRRSLLRRLIGPNTQLSSLPPNQRAQVSRILALSGEEDIVFRVLPNLTAGWAFTPRTRFFTNYFMIRDSLMNHVQLNTTIHSIAYGAQHDIPIGKGNLQLEMQFRELFQARQQPVFDFLPGITFTYVLTPRTVGFVNALLQMRGQQYFQAPTREIDPFYTWGLFHQRGGWGFAASSTFVQNFRQPFAGNASIPVNNYAFICDFEVNRRLFRQLPGLQAFVRAEPIFNFHSKNTPGLSGTDFRLFWGLRMAASKPALTTALDSLRRQLEEQEVAPPTPTPSSPKPSAYLQPEQVVAASPQPIHGFMNDAGETCRGALDELDSVALRPHTLIDEQPNATDVNHINYEASASVPALMPARTVAVEPVADTASIDEAEISYTEL